MTQFATFASRPILLSQFSSACKPGLSTLLTGNGVLSGKQGFGAAAASGAVWSGLSCMPTCKAEALYIHEEVPDLDSTSPATQEPSELQSIWSVFHPLSVLGVYAKNIGVNLILKLNVYMVALLDHEQKAIEAESQGQVAPPAPQLPDFVESAKNGLRMGTRELSVRFVTQVYKHLLVWRLGAKKAAPFLRNGVLWISHVLAPSKASLPPSHKLFSFLFAMLHANAMLYAAECTVSLAMYGLTLRKAPVEDRKLLTVCKRTAHCATFHLFRCSLLLLTTSAMAALGSLAKPGIGTRLGWLASDVLTNQAVNALVK